MPRVNKCMYMAYVCFMSVLVTVCGSVGVLIYVVSLCKGCDRCCIFYCDAWSCRCLCMQSVSVSSCRWCMFVSCVYPVSVFNAAFCTTFSLLMLVKDARGDHTEV